MYSYERRKKAVELYQQYDESLASVQRKLGYPKSKCSILAWNKEFSQNGDLRKEVKRTPKYTNKQRKTEVEYYLAHGKNSSKTCKKLGYSCRPLHFAWILEGIPGKKYNCRKGSSMIKYTQKEK